MSTDEPAKKLTPDSFMAWWPVVVRIAALAGVAWQTAFERFDRPYLLGLFGMMMGFSEIASALRERKNGP